MAGNRMLADREDKTRFESGFRVMNGEQEFVTYHQGTTLRVWYGDVPDHYSDHWHAAVEIALPISGSLRYTVQGREYLLREKAALLLPARFRLGGVLFRETVHCREQDALGNLALFCCNMWCTHDEASLSFVIVEIFIRTDIYIIGKKW